jgi:hypothetical protein
MNDSVIEGVLNTFTVQWNVDGALDGDAGDTLAQGLAVVGNVVVKGQQDEEGVWQIANDGAAGIFDVDALGKAGAYGERYVHWIYVESNTAAGVIPVGFAIRLVFQHPVTGDFIAVRDFTSGFVFGADRTFYSSEPLHVPQGFALQFVGLPAPAPGEVNIVKMSVQYGTSSLEDAALHRAMCCDGGGSDGGDEPVAFLSRQYYSFSNSNFQVGTGEDGVYVQFSANYDNTDPDTVQNLALSLQREDEGSIPISSERLTIRPGSVTGMTVRTSTAFNARTFVEVAEGAGAFVRTFASVPQVFAANVNNLVTISPVAFPLDSRIRVGLLITDNALLDFLQVDIEITTAE